MSGIGDNSVSSDTLRPYVEDCEKLIEQRKLINEQIKDLLDGAESKGLDKKTIRDMIRLRALDKTDRDEREQLRDIYMCALGLD